MKNKYTFLIKNERGVIYPWMFVIGTLVITCTLYAVQLYHNELKYTESLTNSYIYQNLLEVAEHALWERWDKLEIEEYESPQFFQFPLGTAEADCQYSSEDLLSCQWLLTTNTGQQAYKSTNYVLPST
ncbi:hypothetical protein LCM20_05815 [Halobacillus litoralis]|uniref:hypothetical protein n=1 Tax=Halobacillus litoralis TaxID=45668 RepID=UPI001CD5A85D|nr:hypothetical protein [Halobacillus litoralis]MCA0970094.1 hypothetical protein [Halobacillus litoralis]